MKALYYLTALLFFTSVLFPQQKNIPSNVKEALKKSYPNVTDVKWDKERNDYEASFKELGKNKSILLNSNGNILETEEGILISELPANATNYIKNNYKGYTITEAAKIVKSNDEIMFEAEITKSKTKKDILFDGNGKPEKKEIIKNDEIDNEDKD